MGVRWIQNPFRRRVSVAVVGLILAVLCVWPRSYLAKAELLPDSSGGGLASLFGAGGGGGGGTLASLSALLGGRQSIETVLTIARSQTVATDVANRLRRGKTGPDTVLHDGPAKGHAADVEVIRGGILQITVADRDPEFAKAVVSDYVLALRDRLEALNLEQTSEKKSIAADRMAEATDGLSRAQAAVDGFRLANRLALPEAQLGAGISLVTELQAKLQAQETELATLTPFATGDNIQVQSARAQIGALRSQIAAAQTSANLNPGPSVGGMAPKISEYQNLFRNEKYAEAKFDIYKRYLDTITIEKLSATINMQVIEPPYIDPARQYNEPAIAALFLILLLGVLAEFYVAQPAPGASLPGRP